MIFTLIDCRLCMRRCCIKILVSTASKHAGHNADSLQHRRGHDGVCVCVQDLEERLSRYQVKCDRLQLKNNDLEKKLRQQLEDQEQMITFLKRKNQEQALQFMDLEEKLLALKQAKEMEREKLEAQLTTLKEDSQRALDQAAMENKMLQAQLDSLENFKQNKEKLERDLKAKDEMIEQLKKDHEEMVYNLEKKAVLDKDRYVSTW